MQESIKKEPLISKQTKVCLTGLVTLTATFLMLMPKVAQGDVKNASTDTGKTSTLIVDKMNNKTKSWDSILQPILTQREQQLAEAAKKEKEAAEARAAQQIQKVQPVPQAAPVAPGGSCQDWMTQAGITDQANAYVIIMRESGCNPNSVNRSSGACGIPQALPCSKLGTSDPVEQLRWMQNYVVGRYGSWAGAVAWWNSHHWY